MGQVVASLSGKMRPLQSRMGYNFKDPGLLDLALRHSSSGPADNQRLEFLGDRVLGLVMADLLYQKFPDQNEGELAPRFNYLVRKGSCAKIADDLALGDELYLGRSEAKSGGRRKTALLGDVMEAVIGAVYLDGGFEAAREFITAHWTPLLTTMPEETVDAKTRLQELLQSQKKPTPIYEITGREGPDHAPIFTVECKTGAYVTTGDGNSRRIAEQHAATAMLKLLEAHA